MKNQAYLWGQIVRIIGELFVWSANISNRQSVRFWKVEEVGVLGAINSTKDILVASFSLDMELKGAIFRRLTGKVDIIDFVETDINWRLKVRNRIGVIIWAYLVQVHEASFEWEENACLGLVVARDTTAALIGLETAWDGDFSVSDSLHQAGDDFVRSTTHVSLQLVFVLCCKFTLVQLQLQVTSVVLVEEANNERVSGISLLDRRIHRDHKENLAMILK